MKHFLLPSQKNINLEEEVGGDNSLTTKMAKDG